MSTTTRIIALTKKDAQLFKKLCDYANGLMDYPGHAVVARTLGYKDEDSVRHSLTRLSDAKYITLHTARRITAITINVTGKRVNVRTPNRAALPKVHR